MFDRIAGIYDRLNSVMTAGLHHQWRRRAADLAAVRPGDRVLDVATGTGDLAFELAARVAPEGEVVGSDFSERMLDARAREGGARGAGRHVVRFELGNALALPYADASFDAATVGFGARNFSDLRAGPARDGPRRAARRPGRRARDHDSAAAAAVHASSGSGSTASCRCSGGSPATPTPTAICRVGPALSRTRSALAALMWDRGLRASATCSPPAGSSRSTSGEVQ